MVFYFLSIIWLKAWLKSTIWKQSNWMVLHVSLSVYFSPSSPSCLLSALTFLCTLHHQLLKCDTSVPPVCSSLSHFHLPHCPSVHLSIQILRGRALRLSVHAASLKAVQWHVQSFEYISAYSGCYMLALFCVCTHLRPRNAFPMELCNTPVLSQKVPVHHTKKWQRKRDSWDTLW